MAKKSNVKETTKPETSSGVVIATCNCRNLWQDRRYGVGKRVFNMNMRDKTKNEGRCTVCGSKKTI